MIALKSAAKSISINEVDESIFSKRYCTQCLDFSCADACCCYGCQVDIVEKDRILVYAAELEPILGISPSGWFQKQIIRDADYPSGEAVRTRVYNDRCVFYDYRLRGCFLHRFAIEKGMDRHLLKPMVCFLFPLAWEEGCLFVAGLLDELPCKEQGVSVFEAQKEELKFYFGDAFVFELQRIAIQINSSKTGPKNP